MRVMQGIFFKKIRGKTPSEYRESIQKIMIKY